MPDNKPDDFVEIVAGLTNFVQNERVKAYNEGIDMMLGNVKMWMLSKSIKPEGTDLPSLLDEIDRAAFGRPTLHCG